MNIRVWPAETLTRDARIGFMRIADLYAQEMERIFRGDTWSFLCL